MSQVKDEVRKLLDEIPEDATWDDIMYEFYVRKKVRIGTGGFGCGPYGFAGRSRKNDMLTLEGSLIDRWSLEDRIWIASLYLPIEFGAFAD